MIDTIVILDYGSQYTQLIARKIRECNVHSIILPYNYTKKQISKYNIKGIILSGGPASVYEGDSPKLPSSILDYNVPILGVCYGFQLLVNQFGGIVQISGKAEYGNANINLESKSLLLDKINKVSSVWMSHGDKVQQVPDGWIITSRSDNDIISSSENLNLKLYGVQFHLEVSHTFCGSIMINNFLFKICKVKDDWTPENFINEAIHKIRKVVGTNKVICALSGGVDSTVVGTLMRKAIGSNAICVFIDHGMLRKDEELEVMDIYNKHLNLDVSLYDKSEEFLKALDGIDDPEQKRKIIGTKFIEEFEKISLEYTDIKFLAQGTLYPDVIESGGYGKVADKIKSHHNVGGLPEKMKFDLIEPVSELFKDEVRKIGRELTIPNKFLMRHPFPGPGLSIRIIGEITKDRLKVLKESDDIFINLLHETNNYNNIWQAFCVLLPIKTVGVMGDKRTYENVICLRMVTSIDGMTADWYNLSEKVLKLCSNKIVNEVKGVNRVVLDITSKPPGTIEWE
ncbi:glutamine-hydrolyzing GMP synthase [Candidatus Marinimicrobia bacterium]|nr:glutamine-hydrolyzing GMP synthase [Candidatus Neomarinimicrobiota bacterium]